MKDQSMRIGRAIALLGAALILSATAAAAAQDGGYNVTSELWAKAVLQVATTPVTLVWKEVGSDTTATGARVVSGYFYADPNDFAYGSQYNPELFVKIYIDPSGWCNMAFNHVTVDPVVVSSALNYSGAAQKTGTATTASRLLEHSYSIGGEDQGTSITGAWSGTWTSYDGYTDNGSANMTQSGSSVSGTMTVYGTDCGNYYNVPVTGSDNGSGAYSFSISTSCGSDSVNLQFSGTLSGDTITGTYYNYVNGSQYDHGTFSMSR